MKNMDWRLEKVLSNFLATKIGDTFSNTQATTEANSQASEVTLQTAETEIEISKVNTETAEIDIRISKTNPVTATDFQLANDKICFPSAVYLVAEKGKCIFADALGFAVIEPEKITAKLDTIYDLASLTKPLVIGLLSALLIERNEIKLDDKIARYFPEFDTNEKREITVLNLLTHTSGFRAWLPFYLLTTSPNEILKIIAEDKLEASSNTKVIYSDLNFLVLTRLIEKIYAKPLDQIAKAEIIERLGLKRTFFNPPKELCKEIAASENGNQYELEVCLSQNYAISHEQRKFFRNYVIWGEVHDGNCWFMGGVSGHAGLFSDVSDTMKIAQQFLAEETSILKPETCRLFTQNFTEGLNEHRSISFQLATTKDSVAFQTLSDSSFGHLGFTGTSLWLDPEKRRIFILFTNRTHKRKPPFANINPIRREFLKIANSILDDKYAGI